MVPGGARDVERRRSEAGVDVDQQGQVADIGDAAHVSGYVVEGGNSEIRQAERSGGNAAARQVDGPESRLLGEKGMVGVDGARDLQRRFFE